ncbi:F0F1 ATP synthase subunit A [Tessaracoccus antarcticus]|uniref:ATP synthase subunit a n=1 Tax=Tessaracoccus antarcticus TaxID=2479848 RepID=A0A3M0G8V4_9ACTN|nr:F0F1 ATP synthase subunit A [Tessaracoccus antarcticus]RMB58842.1 ATP synthase F0 subunit A [Tessaracoccus antarcticus]
MNPGLLPLEGGGYTPPGVDDFKFGPAFAGAPEWLNKPLLQAVIGALLVILLWWWASRNLKVKPTKGQFLAEYVYEFVRNGIARDILHHEYKKFLPYLLGLFSFVLINNWFGEFFFFMFPTFSNVGYAYGLALLSWCIYVGAGFKKFGFGFLKRSLIPEGVPWYLLPLIIPLEFLSTFITRPITLALRLFANMFAGHLVVAVFVVGGSFLLTYENNIGYNVAGGVSVIFSFAILFLELFIGALQAYIFTVLTAQYVSTSISEAH